MSTVLNIHKACIGIHISGQRHGEHERSPLTIYINLLHICVLFSCFLWHFLFAVLWKLVMRKPDSFPLYILI